MNLAHFKTLVWLRWRIGCNLVRRGGIIGMVIVVSLLMMAAFLAVVGFFGALIGGIVGLPFAEPDHLLLVWDVIVIAFLFSWTCGVMIELQRSEMVSMENLLHTPISLSSAFVLNYLSSLSSLTILFFLPAMVGLCIASAIVYGWAMLLMFPLVLAFVLLVTGVTYHFRGWLASQMVSKRKRRAIVTGLVLVFVAVAQLPGLLNMMVIGRGGYGDAGMQLRLKEHSELQMRLGEGKIDSNEFARLSDELNQRHNQLAAERWRQGYETAMDYARIANLAVPIGWLPYGARSAAGGSILPAILCVFGMTAIGVLSLWRSFHTTLWNYTGKSKSRSRRRMRTSETKPIAVERLGFLRRKIFGVSEHASIVALTSIRTQRRSPEAKMALLTPVIFVLMFAVPLLFADTEQFPTMARPFLAIAAMSVTLFGAGMSQLVINAFGFDRHGFRAFVLMPIPRRDILLGKNLSHAIFVSGMFALCIVVVQIIAPISFLHLIATAAQFVAVFLAICMMGNYASIHAAMPISFGAIKPVRPSLGVIVTQILALCFFPATLLPAAAALGAELLVEYFLRWRSPIYLMVSILELVLAVWLYPIVIRWQGELLQRRETKILEAVAVAESGRSG